MGRASPAATSAAAPCPVADITSRASHARAVTSTVNATPPTMAPESFTALPSTAATIVATMPARSVGTSSRMVAMGRVG